MAIYNSLDGVRWLLKANAFIDVQEAYGWTPLHEAADGGRRKIVELLLSHGASTEIRSDNFGITPIYLAANNAHVGVVRMLVDAGANINHIDENGRTPLDEASRRNHFEVVHLLLKRGAFLDTRDRWGYSPLHRACQKGNHQIAKMLLEKGANPSVIERDHWWTPLHEAIHLNRLDVVDQLIRHGAKLELKNDGRYTPLCFAATQRKLGCVKLLVRGGANLAAQGGYGLWSALEEASFYGHYEMAKFLLESGAHPDGGLGEEKGDWGWTPLMRATMNGYLDVCKLLVENRANLHIVTRQGRTATTVAVEYNKEDILAYLRQQVPTQP